MAIRRLPDGTWEFDSVADAVEHEFLLSQKMAQAQNPRRGAKSNGDGGWTAALLQAFLKQAPNRTRQVVAAAGVAADGAAPAEVAKILDSSPYGIGKRVAKVRVDAQSFNRRLPVPFHFVGDAGAKVLVFDAGFLAASEEAKR